MNLKKYVLEQLRDRLEELKDSASDFVYEFDIEEDDEDAFFEFESDWETACEDVDKLLEELAK